jgi:hypothetical protein
MVLFFYFYKNKEFIGCIGVVKAGGFWRKSEIGIQKLEFRS